MIKKLFTKYFLEVVPSIVATVVGAYIVTHYINAKSEADKPKAAVAAPADTSKGVAPQTLKADDSGDRKAEAARLKAEKLALEKAAAERSASDRAENARKAAEKSAAEKLATERGAAEKLASEKTAAEKRERERTTAKAAPVAPPAADASAAPDDKRDATDLARAAIERLRKSSPQAAEQVRAPDVPRAEEAAKSQPERAKVNVVYAPAAASQPSIQSPPAPPSPPAVNVAPPPAETAITVPPAPFPAPVQSEARADDASRLSPPADIPSRPMDLRARQGRTSVTEDVLSAAKSVFHAVVPDSSN